MIIFENEQPYDGCAIGGLLDACFGKSRHSLSSYSLRDGIAPWTRLSLVARRSGVLVGTVRFWPVNVRDKLSDALVPALLLGPLGVLPELRGRGVARGLVSRALDRVDSEGAHHVILVGNAAFFAPLGFTPARPRHITMPGGRDADRLMVRPSGGQVALPSVGEVIKSNRLHPPLAKNAGRADLSKLGSSR